MQIIPHDLSPSKSIHERVKNNQQQLSSDLIECAINLGKILHTLELQKKP